MTSYRLVAKVDAQADGSLVVRSPAVGVADGVPPRGATLNASGAVLTLGILNRRYLVVLPRNATGVVTEQLIEDTATPVAWGQPLLRLGAAGELTRSGLGSDPAGGDAARTEDLIAVPSPSDGVFYGRPTPDSPAYVEEGSAVSVGTVLGLVEVMKSFNQIAYGGAGLPERGTVVRILAEDAAEVAFGQTLFLVRSS